MSKRLDDFEARVRADGLRYDPTQDAPVTTVPDAPVTTLPTLTPRGAAILAERNYYELLGLRVTATGEIRGMR